MTSKHDIKRRLDEVESADGGNLPKTSIAQFLSYTDDELESLPGNRVRLHERVYRVPRVFYDVLSAEADE